MKLPLVNLRSKKLLTIVVFLQCAVYIVAFFDIPIIRQVIGFLYLTLIPGIILLRMLKLENLEIAERILLSVGLSIAFLMFIGLATNEVYPLIGISKPLLIYPFSLTLSFILLLLCLVETSGAIKLEQLTNFFRNISSSSMPILFFIMSLPLIGLIGIINVNNSQRNVFLIIAIVAVSISFFLSAFSDWVIGVKFYALLLLAIGLALLCFANSSLITGFIVGWDQHGEFFAFEMTMNNGLWVSAPLSVDPLTLQSFSTLSVTILPTIYSQTLGLDGTWVFKILYSLITVFVSLGVYEVFSTQIDKKKAFFATFFFVIISMGYGWGSDKQIVGQLFYVLLFLVILRKGIPYFQKSILFMTLSFALIVSHYSLSYIFMFTILFAWVFLSFVRNSNRKMPLTFVTLFFILAFSWYVFVSSGAAFSAFVNDFSRIGVNFFTDFFNPTTRGTEVLAGVSATSAVSFLHQLGRYVFYATEFLLVIGFAYCFYMLVAKRSGMNFDLEYMIFACVNMAFVFMGIVVPNLAGTFLMERFFQTSLIILAPFCIVGIDAVLRYLPRMKSRKFAAVVTLGILIPNFIFQIGLIYEVAGDQSWSIPLSLYRLKNEDPVWLYNNIVTAQEVLGAKWLPNHANITSLSVYADYTSQLHVLLSYGEISMGNVQELQNTTRSIKDDTFVYLRYLNVVNGKITSGSYPAWNVRAIAPILEDQNKVYSNGGCEIYKGLPSHKTITAQD